MNSYFYEFQIGFNFWMIYVIVMVGVMVCLGLMQHRWHTHYRTRQVFDDSLFIVVAVAAGIILAIWLAIESGNGIVQMRDNNLTSDAYAWQSAAGMPLVALMAGAIFAAILYAVGRIVALVKLGWLHREMTDRRYAQMHKCEAKQLTRRQAVRYKLVEPTYMRSVTVIHGAEQRGNQVHRMRVICDEDWMQVDRRR